MEKPDKELAHYAGMSFGIIHHHNDENDSKTLGIVIDNDYKIIKHSNEFLRPTLTDSMANLT